MPLSDLFKTHLLLQHSSKFKRLTNNKCQPEYVSLSSGFSSLLQTMDCGYSSGKLCLVQYCDGNTQGISWYSLELVCQSLFPKSKKGPFLVISFRSSRPAKQSTVKAAPFLSVVLKSATEKYTMERNITNPYWKIQANKHYSSISTLLTTLRKASGIWPKYHFSISNISVELLPWYLRFLNGFYWGHVMLVIILLCCEFPYPSLHRIRVKWAV